MKDILFKSLVFILFIEVLFVLSGLLLIKTTPKDPKPIYEYYNYLD